MDAEPKYRLPDPELIIGFDPPISRKDGGAVDTITLREPTAAQVRSAETHLRGGVNPLSLREYQLALVTSVSRVSREVIDQMPISKLSEGADYLQDFITPPPITGKS